MTANYLHGIETVELKKGPVPVSVVKSAVIGLVGIAPIGPMNTLTLVKNEQDAAQFGEQVPGYNIPKALADIFKQGAGTVLVVNTFSGDNLDTIVDETLDFAGKSTVKLSVAPSFFDEGIVTLKDTDGDIPIDTDLYTVDAFGKVEITDPSLAALVISGTTIISATYNVLDGSTVNASQLIGAYNSTTDVRTGMKCFDVAFSTFGFKPKLMIAPLYSQLASVATELLVCADKYRGHALIDAPLNTAVSAAIAGRGPVAPVGGFNTSSKRAVLCYPHVKAYDIATNANENRPMSQFLAGAIAATDNEEGYWISPSNRELKGVVGLERTITWAVNDASTDANALNEAGIVTVASGYGTGLRTWGNRSAAFPTSTAPDNFVCVRRTADVIHESVELAMLQFIDRPITNGTVDSIRETVNSFMRTLIGRGALVDGVCTYDPAKNEPTELAAGHIVFDITFMPPTPAERITFESFIDISLLKSIA